MTVDELIARWWGKPGGQEHANFHPFISDLCEILGVERPGASEKGKLGSYEYEASVPGGSFRSVKGTGAIDLYKRGHFIMEAKQSYLKPEQDGLDFGIEIQTRAPSGARYDKLMKDAWLQARNYARNLPSGEPIAPFAIVCDVGRAFELYVDPAGNGRDYEFFPDRQSYRIELTDLASDAEIARTGKTAIELLRAIWTAPKSIDPRYQAAEVTRTVAANLAEVSKYLEEGIKAKGLAPADRALEIEETSLFLMRVLFCMFAEDIGLLPPRSFQEFLKEAEGNDGYFANGLRDLFEKMNNPDPGSRFSMALKTEVRYFNGGLFEDSKTYPLGGFLVHSLYEAARQNWRRVEPAIFGTLLEQALEPGERAKLGAHYTPRPYVETLVRATIMDVLEPEWEAIEALPPEEILPAAQAFHDKLAATRVLDPACGTGNFLYVSMELLQSLESKVIERIQTLGGEAAPRIGPQQFYGLELNPRAAKIAELVLWIGWLRNRLKDDPEAVPEPVLQRSANLNMGRHGAYDAILGLTSTGEPDFVSPSKAPWPAVEYIVGNPPFIGKGEKLRKALGERYLKAMARAVSAVPASANFVMQWWDRAAETLASEGSNLVRFGFVTTNTIKQPFNRRIIERWLDGSTSDHSALSIAYAVPDHPWFTHRKGREEKPKDQKKAAAVRIAMTVAQRGRGIGRIAKVVQEHNLETDNPIIEFHEQLGQINSNLTVGIDTTKISKLKANRAIATNGILLAGRGFVLSKAEADYLGTTINRPDEIIRPYVSGSEIMKSAQHRAVIDFSGFDERSAALRAPAPFQHLLTTVAVARKKVADEKKTPDAIKYAAEW